MTITIDGAGRIVVPKKLRDRYNLHAGSELALEPEVNGIRLTVVGMDPALVRERGILVHSGYTTVDVDVAAVLNSRRENRNGELIAKLPEG